MTKAELIAHIIEHITDPWTESPEDYRYAELIDLDTAKDVLKQCREDEEDFDPEDRMSDEVTPELMMEAFNCNVRYQKHELRIERLTEWLIDNECVCEYDNFSSEYLNNPLRVLPTDFLDDDYMQYFAPEGVTFYASDLIRIGMNSINTFRKNDYYCWFNYEKMQLFSSNTPFKDGIIDAKAFAEYIMSDNDALEYFLDGIIDDDDSKKIFGCTVEELQAELNLKGE